MGIYKIKRDSKRNVARYKVELVANGFNQWPCLDFYDTFSIVIKMTTIRLVLSLALHFNWRIQQLDVKSVFLHGLIVEDIFMTQP